MTRVRPSGAGLIGLVALAGLWLVPAGCGEQTVRPWYESAKDAEPQGTDPVTGGVLISLEESVPEFLSQPEGRYKVVASNYGEGEIDGGRAITALFWIYPPDGVELDPAVSNPQTIIDGDDVSVGSCTYRLDIYEDDHWATLVAVDEPTPGACRR